MKDSGREPRRADRSERACWHSGYESGEPLGHAQARRRSRSAAVRYAVDRGAHRVACAGRRSAAYSPEQLAASASASARDSGLQVFGRTIDIITNIIARGRTLRVQIFGKDIDTLYNLASSTPFPNFRPVFRACGRHSPASRTARDRCGRQPDDGGATGVDTSTISQDIDIATAGAIASTCRSTHAVPDRGAIAAGSAPLAADGARPHDSDRDVADGVGRQLGGGASISAVNGNVTVNTICPVVIKNSRPCRWRTRSVSSVPVRRRRARTNSARSTSTPA